MTVHDDVELTCPSAPPSAEGARVIGIVSQEGGAPCVSYLGKGVVIPEELARDASALSPTRIFRFAARCVGTGCLQFRDGACRLGTEVGSKMGAVVDVAPACSIRSTCRWFAENGVAVCLRCPRVVTDVTLDDAVLMPVAAVPPLSDQGSHSPDIGS